MGNLRDIRRRIKSVKNTSQITRAMQMVASAKMRRAQDQAVKGRPYVRALAEVLYHLQDEIDTSNSPLMQTLGCPILYLEDGKATFYQNFQKLHDRDTSKQPEPAKQEDKPQKAGYGKEQRRRRAEVRTRLKALETEIEELGAHIVELENEINDPEVLRDHLLLRDKCDELDDSRFHQQELYDEWEKLAEEQDRMDAESDS